LRKKGVELVKGITVDIEVPANSDIVIEGYVDPAEPLRREGPFGDHTGFLFSGGRLSSFSCDLHHPQKESHLSGQPSLAGPDGRCLSRQSHGKTLSAAAARHPPEIVDMNLPVHGVFHNLAIISIKKEYPAHARKVMHALWGLGR